MVTDQVRAQAQALGEDDEGYALLLLANIVDALDPIMSELITNKVAQRNHHQAIERLIEVRRVFEEA
jgi:hypothetical protein